MATKKQSKKTSAKKSTENKKSSAGSSKSKSNNKNSSIKKSTSTSNHQSSSKSASSKKSTSKLTSEKKSNSKVSSSKNTTGSKSPTGSKTKSPTKTKSDSRPKTSGKNTTKKPVSAKTTTHSTEKSSKKSSKKKAPEFPTTKWGPDSVISFEATEHLPPPELTSIAGGFVFHNDKLVLANIPGRGWEIIGGRIDVGESPEDTFRRETYTQVGLELSHVKMLGVVRIEHMGPEPPNCPYPFPVGYGVQFIGIAKELTPFKGSSESLGRSLITPEGFRNHYYEWNEYYDAVFRYAFEVYQKLKKKLKL